MSTNIDSLIVAALDGTAASCAARANLRRRAEAGCDRMVEIAEGNQPAELAPLAPLFSFVPTYDSGRLIPFLSSSELDRVRFGARALAVLGGKENIEGLLSATEDDERLFIERREIVHALGEAGCVEAVPRLKKLAARFTGEGPIQPDRILARAQQEYEYEPVLLLVELAETLAKLGDQSLSALSVALAERNEQPDDDFDLARLRVAASSALTYCVAPGIGDAIDALLRTTSPELQRNAMNAVLFLGAAPRCKEVLPLAVDSVAAPDARLMLHEVLGAPVVDDGAELQAWVGSHSALLAQKGCIRLGAPIDLARVIEELGVEWKLVRVLHELWVRTGQAFSWDDDPKHAALSWWQANRNRFPLGAITRSGYLVGDIS